MLREIPPKQAETLLKSMVIPPRPVILLQLEQEQLKPEPDFDLISKLISSDLTLSAAVLKTVNSPFFQLSNRVASVYQALQLLGLKNLGNIVRGVLLRHALTPEGATSMERFWTMALRTALVCAHLAEHVDGADAEEAYTFGLFQDCGMPLMQARFSNYRATMEKGEELSLAKFIELEDLRHQTNHAVVGYLLARTWFLPEHLSLAILNHQDIGIFASPDGEGWSDTCNLIAIAALASHVVKRHFELPEVPDWRELEPVYLRHLAMERSEYEDVADRVNRLLEHA
ncbi:HD-like signal output (HDOD) domain, no enzymatic activity [Formivibrio citricus]|uniref:HD-like signal output (HDOD) domain, no enzymatic activity n=2 Tax=Formivibrio citricus TaxID=83765 RepID=A0A1I4XFN6_9NEIS|nr:HD-like signal output (HDOD) domain, no enzymatic activity [Formivibrio citricus]